MAYKLNNAHVINDKDDICGMCGCETNFIYTLEDTSANLIKSCKECTLENISDVDLVEALYVRMTYIHDMRPYHLEQNIWVKSKKQYSSYKHLEYCNEYGVTYSIAYNQSIGKWTVQAKYYSKKDILSNMCPSRNDAKLIVYDHNNQRKLYKMIKK